MTMSCALIHLVQAMAAKNGDSGLGRSHTPVIHPYDLDPVPRFN
jgi:hypothetical protein